MSPLATTPTNRTEPPYNRKFEVVLGVTVLIFILINILGTLQLLANKESYPDLVLTYEKKFEKLATLLNVSEKIGYLADEERHPVGATGSPDPNLVDLLSMRRYFICQFAVVPAILVHSLEPSRIVGNFSSPEAAKLEIAQHELKVLYDSGNGAVLCGHLAKQ
jgi:hypothetical protein